MKTCSSTQNYLKWNLEEKITLTITVFYIQYIKEDENNRMKTDGHEGCGSGIPSKTEKRTTTRRMTGRNNVGHKRAIGEIL